MARQHVLRRLLPRLDGHLMARGPPSQPVVPRTPKTQAGLNRCCHPGRAGGLTRAQARDATESVEAVLPPRAVVTLTASPGDGERASRHHQTRRYPPARPLSPRRRRRAGHVRRATATRFNSGQREGAGLGETCVRACMHALSSSRRLAQSKHDASEPAAALGPAAEQSRRPASRPASGRAARASMDGRRNRPAVARPPDDEASGESRPARPPHGGCSGSKKSAVYCPEGQHHRAPAAGPAGLAVAPTGAGGDVTGRCHDYARSTWSFVPALGAGRGRRRWCGAGATRRGSCVAAPGLGPFCQELRERDHRFDECCLEMCSGSGAGRAGPACRCPASAHSETWRASKHA
jgi:hypothetical protein